MTCPCRRTYCLPDRIPRPGRRAQEYKISKDILRYPEKPGGSNSKTLRQALQTIGPDGMRGSEVRILDRAVRFTGDDLGNVDQRMPFVYAAAQRDLMSVGTEGGSG